MDNIKGKTIAITGAARGIGYATARAMLARGARVVIGDRDVARLESASPAFLIRAWCRGIPSTWRTASRSRCSWARPAPSARATSTC
ncbi:MAG: hypothetical protein QOI25_1390 [Mycobacterium sp.]|nr:hypothetical protein [Mycobacterium sp.]